MRDEGRKVEGHVDTRVRLSERRAVDVAQQRQRNLGAVEGMAELVGAHRDRREGGRGFGVEEAEAFGELGGNEIAQRDVVDQHDEPDGARRLLAATGHRHIAEDHGDLRLEIDAVGLVDDFDRVRRPEERVRAALIHQRIGPERRRHFRAARLADEFHVVDVGRAVRPLEGARQRRGAFFRIEGEVRNAPGFERIGDLLQPRRGRVPIVERRLQGRHHVRGIRRSRKIARDDEQLPIAAVLERGELHDIRAPGLKKLNVPSCA